MKPLNLVFHLPTVNNNPNVKLIISQFNTITTNHFKDLDKDLVPIFLDQDYFMKIKILSITL